MKRSISKSDRLSLVGLLVLGERLNNQLMQVEHAMTNIVGEDANPGGQCSDVLYGGGMTDDKEYDVDQLLKRLGVTVDE